MAGFTDAIIDLSHHNYPVDFAKAAASGIVAILHKASQGVSSVDSKYRERRSRAKDAGLLWGAYHFGTGDDGVEQAEFFLDAVGDRTDTLMALDLEHNPAGSSMSLIEARNFVTHIHDKVGRWPGLYSGNYIKELLGNKKDPVLGHCWLWLAQYDRTPVIPSNWERWTMWQYTDGTHPPGSEEVPGIGPCDRDYFDGSVADIKSFWGTR